MQQTYICAFDIGVSIDINDDIFEDCAPRIVENKVFEMNGVKVRYPSRKIPDGINLLIGTGLSIDLTGTEIKEKWKKEALKYAYDKSFFMYNPGCVDKITSLFNEIKIERINLNIYSIGVAYLSIDISSIDENKYYDSVIDFYRCFEYSAYYSISEDIKKVIINLLDYFRLNKIVNEDKNVVSLYTISKRFDISKMEGKDLFPGFTCINIFLNERCNPVVLKASQEYESPNVYDYITMDNEGIYLGWASVILETTYDDLDRRLLMIEILWTFQVIAESYEKLFTLKSIDALKNRTKAINDYTLEKISFLKNIATIIIQITTLSNVTIAINEIKVINSFENTAKLTEKHNRIKNISETFLSVQNELISEENRKKENILSNFVLIITSLTFISVTTDIIGTLDFDNRFMTSRMLRIIVLFASLAIGFSLLGVMLFMYKRQEINKLIKSIFSLPTLFERARKRITHVKIKQQQINDIAKEIITSQSNGKLLVIGSGAGSIIYADGRLFENVELYGIEASKTKYNLAKKYIDKSTLNIKFFNGDIKESEFRNEIFDIIVYNGSFRWWDGAIEAFNEVFRLLKPGGAAYFYTLDKDHGNSSQKDLDKQLKEHLKQENFIKRISYRFYISNQLKKAYNESEIKKTIIKTKFKDKIKFEKAELGGLSIWLKIILNK
jgi:ubiquinone/menaquinone biosynthesis C-methylase UbiE